MDLKFSIITPSLNQGRFIRDTIESVLNQNYQNFEHIIIDGGSSDDTIDILKEYPHLKWISEKDSGAASAISNGFKLANGDIFTWLNSDDYFEKNIFKEVEREFKNKDTRIVVGNMINTNLNKEIFSINSEIYDFEYLVRVNPDIVKQPSTFFRKEMFFEAGGFDQSLKLVWDYDLFIKMFKISKPKFIDKILAYQRIYDTTLSGGYPRKQAMEIFRVSRKNGARIYDRINYVILKRFLFPSLNKEKQSIIVRSIKNLKRALR